MNNSTSDPLSGEIIQTMINSVGDSVIATNLSGEIIFWNKGAEKLYRWKSKEVIGKNITDITPSHATKKQAMEIMNSLQKGNSWEGNFEVQDRDGRLFMASVTDTPIIDKNGKLIGIIGISRDISESIKNQKEIENLSKECLQIIESISDGFFVLNSETEVTYFNEMSEKLLGRKKEDVLGKPLFDAFPEARGSIFEKNYLHAIKQQKALQFETYFETVPYTNWYEVRVFPNKGGISVFFLVITKRKMAEKILQDNHEEIASQNEELISQNEEISKAYKSLQQISENLKIEKENSQHYLDIASVMIIAINQNGVVTLANKKASDLLGYSENEIIGKNWFDNFVPKNNKNNIKKIFNRIVKGEISSFEYMEDKVLCKNGSEKWIAWHNSDITNNKGEIIGSLSSGEDITEKKKAQLLLLESEKKYRSLFNNIQEGVALHEMVFDENNKPIDFVYLDCNPTYEKLTLLKKENIIGKRGLEVIPNLEQKWIDMYGKVALTGEPVNIIDHSDYLDKYWDVKAFSPSKNQFAVALTDVTEKIKTEKALKENEEKFRYAMQAAQEGLWDWNIKTNEVYFSPGWAKILGEEKMDQEFSSWEKRLHPDDKEDALKSVQEHLEGKSEFWQMEHRLKTKEEKYKYVLGRGKIVEMDVDNNPTRMSGTMIDISERKKQEESLLNQNEFIQTILDNLPIGLATNKINEGTALYMNKKFEEIYGWPKVELLDVSKFFERIYPDVEYREKLMKQIIEDMQSGDPERMHWENIMITVKDGSKKYVNAVNIPLIKQNIMVSTVMDITDLKKTQEELQNHRDQLEKLIKERTKELEDKNIELKEKIEEVENMNELFVGREFRIKELKDKIKNLEERNKENPYS